MAVILESGKLKELNISLEPLEVLATFKTRVYDAETFEPVYHALVSMGIFPSKTPVISSGYTDASGYWETDVPADTYRITYSKSGYLDYDRKVDVYIGMSLLVTHLPPTH